MDHDLDLYFKAANDVATEAGEMIKSAYSQEKRIETKSSLADLVTETDKAVEDLIINTLHEKFPSHKFIGEESVSAGKKCELNDDPTWIIDPIDGTSNFVHRFPHTAVCIGLLINKKTEIGIVFNPITGQKYHARRGQGAYCNTEKLQVTNTTELGKALIMTEFGSQRKKDVLDSRMRTMRKLIDNIHGLRSCGSAAVSMVMVAAGNADAYYEFGIHCWDIAAAELIVREAGGVVVSPSGEPLDLMARRVLCAGTKELAMQIVPYIEQIEFERD